MTTKVRALRRTGLALIPICLVVGGLLGYSGSRPNTTATLRAERLELVDRDGKLRATLGVESGGLEIKMFDRKGGVALVMEVKNDSPADRPLITFFDSGQRPSAALGYPAFLISDTSDVSWVNKTPMLVFTKEPAGVEWHAPPGIVGPWEDARFIR